MTDEKTTASDSKVAATGAAPVSDEKAAATAQEYEQLTGQDDTPGGDSDPVMDSILAAEADVEQPDIGEPAWVNKDYEEREQVEYVDTSGDDDSDDDDSKDEPEKKPAAKKTAAKK